MYKILIVDDEKIVKLALKKMIEFDDLYVEVIGDASDGVEALDFIKHHHVDIVITDLMMPNMDGLQLIDKLNDMNFKGQLLVLSNHDDFDLVRQALKSGAADYLLKGTMQEAELKNILTKSIEALNTEKLAMEEMAKTELEVKRGQKLFREKAFRSLLLNKTTDEGKVIKEHDFKVSLKSNDVIYLQIDSLKEAIASGTVIDVQQMVYSIKSILEESIKNRFEAEIIDLRKDEFVIVVSHDLLKMPMNLCLKIIKKLNMYVNQKVSIVLATDHQGDLSEIVHHCRRYSEYKFYTGTDQVLEFDHKVLEQEKVIYYEKQMMVTKGLVFESDWIGLYEHLESFIQSGKQDMTSPSIMKQAGLVLLKHIMKVQMIDDITVFRYDLRKLREAVFIHDYLKVLKGLLSKIEHSDIKQNNQGLIHEKVDYYIKNHLDKKITLKELSEYVHLNSSYLSRLFKKVKGVSLIEYINGLKMEQAKQLLKSDMNIEQVGQKIGISDPFYFNKVFKKTVGVSPTVYKKSLQK